MVIKKDWADSLNIANPNSSSTLLADLMNQGLQHPETVESWDLCWPVEGQSIILSAVLADGLGRIGSEYDFGENILICQKGWCSIGLSEMTIQGTPFVFNGTISEYEKLQQKSVNLLPDNSGRISSHQMMYSFPQPPDHRERWTEVSFRINRYGYGWAFNNKLVKAAAAVLITHAIVIIAHCCHIIISGQYYRYIDSLGELVALALKSQPPKTLDSSSTGISSGQSVWSQPAAVRHAEGSKDYEQRLELVVGPECTERKGNTVRRKSPYTGT